MSVPVVRAAVAVVAMLVSVLPGQAQITRFVVEQTEALGRGGSERLTGHVYGEVNLKLPLNAIITDLEFASRNARGLVEYTSTFTMVKPADMANASGLLIWVTSNRGRIDLTADGFFADARRQGHVLVTSGWQGDLAPAEGRETMSVPVARNLDGSSITDRVQARFDEMPPGATTLPILRGGVAGTARGSEKPRADGEEVWGLISKHPLERFE